MSDYDFSSLNDKEFEGLSVDLLSCHFGARIERFKAGRDSGVDGRFFSSEGDEVIIQCKHWLKSGLAALIRSIESTEAEKVKSLNPRRYIFITSLELSRANKIKIKNLFSPYILSESDVFGNEDLNDILSKNIAVERKHYKLWISSSNVLKTILNSAIIGRSKHKLEEIVEESNRYVVTHSHSQAMDKLEKIHSVIITGSPGVGKTSLADQLCQYYSAKGYEFCFIENSLNEAEDIYREESKQVFYFDDFLGRNFLLALNSHQDSHIINFIKRIEKDKKKRFILTSRSNILNQGKRLSDLFDIKNVKRNEYELSIASLTDIDKAKILYNHIWFGGLDEEYISEIYKEKRYLKIIKHKNFNPRLISFITDYHRLSSLVPSDYWEYIDRTLSNPKDIWRNVFEVQIDDICRHIVVAVCLHGKPLSEMRLRSLYDGIGISNINVTANKSYDMVQRLLVGALLNRSVLDKDNISYDLFNPSIADFVISNYLGEFNYIDELLISLRTPESISNLNSLKVSGVIDKEYYCNILESQLIRLSLSKNGNKIDSYKLRILSHLAYLLSPKAEVLEYIKILTKSVLSSGPCSYGIDYFEFINWALSLDLINTSDLAFQSQLRDWVYNYKKDMEEFIPISKLVAAIDIPPSDLTTKLKDVYIDYLSADITRDVIEVGIMSDAYDSENCDFSEIFEYIENRFSELEIPFEEADVELVSEHCNIDDIIQFNIDSAMHEDHQYDEYKGQRYSMRSTTEAIDDLFDRS
ncbi:MAG: restriction endonuclease [Pseudomonadota bacterium]|nr:restriction endonuclease [Pseudomonadota bacterium]